MLLSDGDIEKLRQTYIKDMPMEAFFTQIGTVGNAIDKLQNFVTTQHLYNSAIKEITTKLEADCANAIWRYCGTS